MLDHENVSFIQFEREPRSLYITTECVNSLVARFARKFLSKFPRPVGHTIAAVQPSKKKIARGTYINTF